MGAKKFMLKKSVSFFGPPWWADEAPSSSECGLGSGIFKLREQERHIPLTQKLKRSETILFPN